MHEVEVWLIRNRIQILLHRLAWHFLLKGEQPFQPKHCVIKITPARAVLETAVLVLLAAKEIVHQSGGFAEELRRQPGHLQHLQSNAHAKRRQRGIRPQGLSERPPLRSVIWLGLRPASRPTPLASAPTAQ